MSLPFCVNTVSRNKAFLSRESGGRNHSKCCTGGDWLWLIRLGCCWMLYFGCSYGCRDESYSNAKCFDVAKLETCAHRAVRDSLRLTSLHLEIASRICSLGHVRLCSMCSIPTEIFYFPWKFLSSTVRFKAFTEIGSIISDTTLTGFCPLCFFFPFLSMQTARFEEGKKYKAPEGNPEVSNVQVELGNWRSCHAAHVHLFVLVKNGIC